MSLIEAQPGFLLSAARPVSSSCFRRTALSGWPWRRFPARRAPPAGCVHRPGGAGKVRGAEKEPACRQGGHIKMPGAQLLTQSRYNLGGTRSIFPGGSEGKASACNGGDLGSIPGLGGSPGEGNGYPLQYSCLENPTDGGAW